MVRSPVSASIRILQFCGRVKTIFFIYLCHCQVELCPIENALESVLNRNKDMQRVIAQCQADPAQGVMSLGMSVNGVIDAAVNGGVAKYEMVCHVQNELPSLYQLVLLFQAFFGSEYLKANADHEELVAKLRDAITHQESIVCYLNFCIVLSTLYMCISVPVVLTLLNLDCVLVNK